MTTPSKRLLLLGALALAACAPTGAKPRDGGSLPGVDSGRGNPALAPTCASIGGHCGTFVDDQYATGDCGLCSFTAAEIASVSSASYGVAAGPQGLLVVLSEDHPENYVYVAREQADGTFVNTTVESGDSSFNVWSPPRIAVGPAGEHWVAYTANASELHIARSRTSPLPDGGLYDIQVPKVPSSVVGIGGFTVDASGYPHVVYAAVGRPVFNSFTVEHAYQTADGWKADDVETFTNPNQGGNLPAVTVAPSGTVHVTYVSGAADGGVRHAVKTGATFSLETVEQHGGEAGLVDTQLDAAGKLHIAYQTGVGNIGIATQTESGWKIEHPNFGLAAGEEVSLALDGEGKSHLVYDGRQALEYSESTSSFWTTQHLVPDGNLGKVVIDQEDHVRIVTYGPRGSTGLPTLKAYALSGKYSDPYVAACSNVATQVCAVATGCGKGTSGDVCWFSAGSTQCTSNCVNQVATDVCGDPTRAESPLLDCNTKLSQVVCAPLPDSQGDEPKNAANVGVCGDLF